MRHAPSIAKPTKAVDLENLGGPRGITESQECVRFDLAREMDQPAISDKAGRRTEAELAPAGGDRRTAGLAGSPERGVPRFARHGRVAVH